MIDSLSTRASEQRRLRALIFVLALGSILTVMFVGEIYLSKRALAALMLTFTVWGFRALASRSTPMSILPRLMLLIYALPFSVTLGYLFDKDYMWVFTPAQIIAAQDDILIRQMLTIGLVGLLGLIAGMCLADQLTPSSATSRERQLWVPPKKTLDPALFLAILAIPLFMSWFGAPPETILAGAYVSGQSASGAEKVNMGGASAKIGYAFLLVLALDLMRETNPKRRQIKRWAWGGVFGFILLYFQILRGDRDIASTVAAVVFLYLVAPTELSTLAERAKRSRNRARKMALPVIALIILFLLLGVVRSELASVGVQALNIDPVKIATLAFQATTWTAVLYTDLSTAYAYRTGMMNFHYGQTYLDYMASLTPGFIAQAIGFERALEPWRGPAWEVNSALPTAGGLHEVVVPFWNFGIFGVLFIMLIIGCLIGLVEIRAQSFKFWPSLIWMGFLLGSMEWFWYGDMIFIRSLMAIALAGLTYQVALGLKVMFVTYMPAPRGRLSAGIRE